MPRPVCEVCGQPFGQPHLLLDSDCVLAHGAHVDREVGLLCKRHFHLIADTLRQLEELLALLPEVLEPSPGAAGGRSATRVGSPAPGRLEVMAVSDRRAVTNIPAGRLEDDLVIPDVAGGLEDWLRRVADEHPALVLPFAAARFAVDGRGRVGAASEAAEWRIPWTVTLRLLHRERRWIAQQPWVAEYAADLVGYHRTLARATRAGMWAEPIGACVNCGARLYVTPGIDAISCTRCKSTWSGVHYLRLRLMLEQEVR